MNSQTRSLELYRYGAASTNWKRKYALANARFTSHTDVDNMFEITPDEIAKLTDADLRDLVGLLCEATLRESHLPTSAVTYGGNQDASDGGLDVRVTLPNESKISGFIPKPRTGFQVKKPDLKPSEIGPEMRPRGKLRASIKELVDQGGAYVIVSSAANLTDKASAP